MTAVAENSLQPAVQGFLSGTKRLYIDGQWVDAASGGLVVVVQGVVFGLVYLFSPRHGLLGRRLARGRRAAASVAAS